MRTKRISIIALFVAMVAAFTMLFVTNAKVAKADPATFAFEEGAYVKLSGDGGLRFRLKMDEDTANEIKGNASETLYFYVASAARMNEVTTGAAAKALNTAGNAWEVEVDKDKIYAGKDELGADDGYFYANVLIDANNIGNDDAAKLAYRTTDFVAAATVYDASSTSYTSFVKSVERSMQDTASAGALRGGYYTEVAATYAWLGTSEDYAIVAANAADYTALCSALSANGSLYFYLDDDVTDGTDLLGTYANGSEGQEISIGAYSETAIIGDGITVPSASIVGKVSGETKTTDGISVSATLRGTPVDVSGGTYQPLKTGSLVITYSADGVANAVATITVVNEETLVTKNDLISKTSYVYYYGNSYYLGNPPSANYAGEKSYCIQLNCPSEPASYLIFEIEVGDVSKYDHLEMQFWALHSDGGTWNVKAGNSDGTTLFTGTGWRGFDNPVTIDVATSYVNNGKLRLTLYQNYYNTCELYIQYIKGVLPEEILTAEERAFAILSTASSYGSSGFNHGVPGAVTVENDEITVEANAGSSGGRGFVLNKAALLSIYSLGFDTMKFTLTTGAGGYCDIYANSSFTTEYISGYAAGGLSGNDFFYQSGDTVTVYLDVLANHATFNDGLKFVVTTSASLSTKYMSDTTITFSDIVFGGYTSVAQKLLSKTSSWGDFKHGTVGTVTSDYAHGTITVGANKSAQNDNCGVLLNKDVLISLYNAGFATLSFTLTTGAGGYCDIYANSTNYLSGYAVDTGSNDFLYVSGTTVTVYLNVLANDAGLLEGLKFVIMTGASWSPYTGGNTTLTFSNIVLTAPV